MLTYDMNQRGEEPLYAYLYECMRADIECGAIAAGEKLPSKRKLADHLGVSIVTVEGAYRQLVAEGYVESRARRGYYAAKLEHAQKTAATWDAGTAARPGHTPHIGIPQNPASAASAFAYDLSRGAMPSGLFPLASWSKALRDTLTQEAAGTLIGEVDPMGCMPLRTEISKYLREMRGLSADPECIVIGSGAQTLYNLLVQLIGRNRIVGIEDPGYPRLTKIYQANNVEVAHLPLDASGVRMDSVHESGVSTLHLMPSHQFPTGIVTSVSRRHELLGWATEAPSRYIIEDDYDCEFRLAGRPIPTLQGIDASERVIYTNTFSKSLSAAFRIAYMVLPPHLAQRYRETMSFYSCTVPAIDQLALARFMERGEFERHVNRLRTHARNVRDAFIGALKSELPENTFSISGQDAGLHFVIEFAHINSKKMQQALETESASLPSLSEFAAREKGETSNKSQFVVQYLSLSEEEAKSAAHAIAKAYLRGGTDYSTAGMRTVAVNPLPGSLANDT